MNTLTLFAATVAFRRGLPDPMPPSLRGPIVPTACRGRLASRASAIACFLLMTIACGEDDPLGPSRTPTIDLTPLVELLDDPLVRLLPTTIDDPAFVTPLQAELASLRQSSVAGHVPAVRRTLESVRLATQRYVDRSDIDAGHRAVLAAIELVLERAAVLFEELVARSTHAEATRAAIVE